MSKKTFSAAPKPKQPTDDQILAFERGGAGHDTTSPQQGQSSLEVSERSKRLSLDLPESLHTRFKTACSATGNKMASELLSYVVKRTAELEEEAGLSRK